ncbi:unnamed protein product [Bursaphelenchus okinawaensis]|uniref:Flap endonuclease 1 n=1 Tax=Bursaphelenchus okinawaensis TaxID=465554 RepID=A0A811JQZ5_9BILA|nr:unnamed protein product [Bursaphelenchus okinawaensis]CAG9078985.1 unnamed protein product [Bursaphelenchus okinawaensis]
MGIKDLNKVITENASKATKEAEMKAFLGRKVAVDASMSLYQFLIAIRQDNSQLTNEKGETTSHLNGMFYRTIRMMENGLKPVYVFDGKPPEMKSGELEKRTERRDEAQKLLDEAMEKGDAEMIEKFERRLVKVTKEQNEQVKRLLRAMGVPVVEAPCEAEAQCAELVKKNKVYGTATEDMDALTFGSTVLLRHLTFSEAKKIPIKEYNLPRILEQLEITNEQFIDLCILLGCDYCPSIRGIGPKKAFEYIKQYGTIENLLENLDTKKYPPPENWKFAEARELFRNPEVADGDNFNFVWKEPNQDEILQIMCTENQFNEDRIKSALERLKKTRETSQQVRIDSFFTSMGSKTSEPSAKKRKEAEEKNKSMKKKGGVFKKKK